MLKKFNKVHSILLTIGAIVTICLLLAKWTGLNLFTGSNAYVTSVKDGKLDNYPQATVGAAFDKHFSSEVWKHKKIDGTHYVTFSGYTSKNNLIEIKFRITDDENHFLYEEGKVNGEANDEALLSEMESAFAVSTTAQADTTAKENASLEAANTPTAQEPVESDSVEQSSPAAQQNISNNTEITLKNFLIWGTSNPDKQLHIKLDGEQTIVIVGNDSPNGIKLLVTDSMDQGWKLELPLQQSSNSPFDDFGDLKSGFNIYLKDHDFDGDGTPELVVVASNQLDESFIWVFSYNFVASENGTAPLELIWSGEGQSDVTLQDNKIFLPYGSQGLFEEFDFSAGKFIKQ